MLRVLLGLLVFAASNQPGIQNPKERLESIREAQNEASKRYQTQWAGAKTEEQKQKVVDEFLAKVVVNADRALDLSTWTRSLYNSA
jgi:hypothetical protein